MTPEVEQCVGVIASRAPGFVPRVGIVLGSGLGDYADQVQAICRAFRRRVSPDTPAS